MLLFLAGLALFAGIYTALKIEHNTKPSPVNTKVNSKTSKQELVTTSTSARPKPATENSPAESYARQQQYVALSSLGFAGLGILVNPIIALGAVPLIAINCLSLFREVQEAYQDESKHKSKLMVAVFDIVSVCLALFMASFLMITLLQSIVFTSRRLVVSTERQTEADFSRIFAELSSTVWLLKDEIEIEVALGDVQIGDIVVVHAGEMIPVDGQIVAGEGLLDQHLLTGEFQPVEKKVGDGVFTSTLLISGAVQVRVEQHGDATITGQIALTLEQVAAYKKQVQSRGDQIVEKGITYTLLACGASLPFLPLNQVVALSYSGFGYQMRAAAPLLVYNSLRVAAQQGIIIKDGRALDQLHRVDTVVFDKTGTLTEDIPQIAQMVVCGDLSQQQLLQYAASAEQRQQHPIGLAICASAKQQDIPLFTLNSSDYAIGHGLRAELFDTAPQPSKHIVMLGSRRFIEALQLTIPAHIEALQTEASANGHSVVYVAMETATGAAELLGVIELMPVLRPQAEQTIIALHELGIKTAIISGDQQQPTQHLAMGLGIDDYFAETLPKDKAKIVADLQAQGRTVCFVGDGINDAVALQQADVSVSLHSAAAIAQDTADIVLLTPNLLHIPHLLHMSTELHRLMNRGEHMNMISGVLCMVGVIGFGMGLSGALLLYSGGAAMSLSNAMVPLLRQDESPR